MRAIAAVTAYSLDVLDVELTSRGAIHGFDDLPHWFEELLPAYLVSTCCSALKGPIREALALTILRDPPWWFRRAFGRPVTLRCNWSTTSTRKSV